MEYKAKRKSRYSLTPVGWIAVGVLAVILVTVIIAIIVSNTGGNSETFSSAVLTENDESSAESDVTTEPERELTVNVTLNKDKIVKLPDKIKTLITDYTKARYEALGNLEVKELNKYFNMDNKYGKMYAAFNNAILDYLIYIRQNRTADLRFYNADVTVNVTSVQVYDDEYIIDYYVNEALSFNFTEEVSYSCNMAVQARAIRNDDGEFLFSQMAEDTDVNLLFEKPMVEALGYDFSIYYLKELTLPDDFDSKAVISSTLKELKASADENILSHRNNLSEYNASPDSFKVDMTADNKYDREKAVAYSYKWVGEDGVVRNPDYSNYSDFGGNCQNYASQCILAGGVPMDCSGDYNAQWKWYGDEMSYYEEEYGRSGSWSGTEYFYEYCNINTGSGLVAKTDGNIYSAQPGDILQYVVDGWASHSVVVSKVIYDDNGNVTEILVNCNTTDRKDYPLTAYGYTDIRLISIIGYNN